MGHLCVLRLCEKTYMIFVNIRTYFRYWMRGDGLLFHIVFVADEKDSHEHEFLIMEIGYNGSIVLHKEPLIYYKGTWEDMSKKNDCYVLIGEI